jgi:hypothetical protein
MKITKILLFLPILTIFACKSNSASDWSCRNLNSKVGCANISKSDDAYLENKNSSAATTSIDANKSSSGNKYTSFEDINLGQTRLVRTPEKIGRLWLAPYMDNKGNYHEASFVRVVDAESKWEKVADISAFDTKPDLNIQDITSKEKDLLKSTSTTTTKNQDQALSMPLAKSNEDNQEEQGDEVDNHELDNVKEINLNQTTK